MILYYPDSNGNPFPFISYTSVAQQVYNDLTKTFPQGAWFGASQLDWENSQRNNQTVFSSWAIKHLCQDPDSRLILYCGHETISDVGLKTTVDLLTSWCIPLTQVHFISASVPQQNRIKQLYKDIKVSAFHHWEMYCAAKTKNWNITVEPQHRFLYLNRRNSKERIRLAYLLLNDDDVKSNCNYSLHPGIYWENSTRAGELAHFRSVMNELPLKYKSEISSWCLTRPWRSITSPERDASNPSTYTLFDQHTQHLIKNSSISIITESHPYQSMTDFMPTEKIIRTIAAQRPFVVLGTHHYLKHLRDMGYKTFDSLWNEDYDREPNMWKRIDMIADTVKHINTMDLNSIAEQIQSITQHNLNMLQTRTTLDRVHTTIDPELVPLLQFENATLPFESQ